MPLINYNIKRTPFIINNQEVSLKTLEIKNATQTYNGQSYIMSPKVEAIGSHCFNHSKLKNIVLSPNLKIICPNAFKRSDKLELIRFPEGLIDIRAEAFEYCESLKEIILPDTIKEIGAYCFRGCTNLEYVKLPKKLEVIEDYLFDYCENLKTIIMPENLKEIRPDALNNCFSLESITIPATTKINSNFANCRSLTEINVKYKNINELKTFATENDKLHLTVMHRLLGIMRYKDQLGIWKNMVRKLIFIGPPLTEEEKKGIIKKFPEEIREFITFKEVKIEEIKTEEKDKEIQQKIEEINKICKELDDTNKRIIQDKIEKLLKEYQKDVEKLKPKYGDNNSIELTFKEKNITNLKPNLLLNLELIELSIKREEKLIQKISEISKYKKYLKMDIEKPTKDDNTIETMIKNIVYYSKFLDEEKKNSYLERLKNAIERVIEKVSKEFENVLDEKINLKSEENYELQLRSELEEIYDIVANTGEKRKPFKELLDVLISKENPKNFIDKDDLHSLINNIGYIIDQLSESKYQEELKDIFIEKKKQYINLVNNILNDKTKLRSITIEDIEKEIRKDITPLLESINKYAYLDKYEGEYIKNNNLIDQLDNCIELIKKGEIINLDNKKERIDSITVYVSEIINKTHNILDNDTREKVIIELLNTIRDDKNKVIDTKIDSADTYSKMLYKIIEDIVEIDYKLNTYINETNEYHKHYK